MSSASNQIEMVWSLDVPVQDAPDTDRRELWAISHFLQMLLRSYQHDARLTAHAEDLLSQAFGAGIEARAGEPLRFLASLTSARSQGPLLDQIAGNLEGKASGCNFILCGSGFFEQSNGSTVPPVVLEAIVKQLYGASVLTKTADKCVVTNPGGRDQLAVAVRAGTMSDWNIHRPRDPHVSETGTDRWNHAKFMFLARRRSDAFNQGWLYLGSGNLSQRGFTLPLPMGNVEAGVLIDVSEDLYSLSRLRAVVPFGSLLKERDWAEEAGGLLDEDEAAAPDLLPPPIMYFHFAPSLEVDLSIHLQIVWAEDVQTDEKLSLIYPDGSVHPISFDATEVVVRSPTVPRFLELIRGPAKWQIPCLDAQGAFVRQGPLRYNFTTWLDELRGFPETWDDPAPDEDDLDPADLAAVITADIPIGEQILHRQKFPAHTAMTLVETIAERNSCVPENQGADWLNRLRDILIERRPLEVEDWRKLEINFLNVLHSPEGFAPAWNDLKEYHRLIDDVAVSWGLSSVHLLEIPDESR